MQEHPMGGLRTRLLLFAFVSLIPLFLLMVLTASEQRRREAAHAQRTALTYARLIKTEYARMVEATRLCAHMLEQIPDVQQAASPGCGVVLSQVVKESPHLSGLALISRDGTLCSAGSLLSEGPLVASLLPCWEQSLKGVPAGTAPPTECAAASPIEFLAFPLSTVPASALFAFHHDWAIEVLRRMHAPAGTLVWIGDAPTAMALGPDGSTRGEAIPPPAGAPGTRPRDSEGVSQVEDSEGTVRLCGSTPLSTPVGRVTLSVGIPAGGLDTVTEALFTNRIALIGALSVLTLFLSLAGADLFVFRKARLLMDAFRQLANGDLSVRTRVRHGRGELNRLAQTFDEMADRLERRQIESEQLEEVLRESGRRFRAMFNQTFQFTTILQPDGRLIEANQAALDLGGVRNADVFEQPFWNTLWWSGSPAAQARLKEAISQAAQGHLVHYEAELSGKDDRRVTIDFSLKPITDEKGQVSLLLAEGRDITSRKEAEKALRESEARYRAIVEDQAELISRFLPDERLTFTNRAYCRFFAEPAEALLGRGFWHHLPPEECVRLRSHIGSLTADHPVATIEHRVLTPSGEERWLQWTDRAIFNDQGVVVEYQAVGRDITERKQFEQSLKDSERELRHLSSRLLTAQEDERKRIAMELHDSIGQSLSAIKFGVERACEQMRQNSSSACHSSLEALVPTVQYAIDEARKIMTDLRPSILDDLGILATIQWFCRDFQVIYADIHIEKELTVSETDIPKPLKIVIFRIIQEAFNNIGKYSKASFVTLSLSLDHGRLELVVEDDGRGFDPASLPAVRSARSGFGLSSMRERAEYSGGSFSIESAPREGTTIRVLWPLTTFP